MSKTSYESLIAHSGTNRNAPHGLSASNADYFAYYPDYEAVTAATPSMHGPALDISEDLVKYRKSLASGGPLFSRWMQDQMKDMSERAPPVHEENKTDGHSVSHLRLPTYDDLEEKYKLTRHRNFVQFATKSARV